MDIDNSKCKKVLNKLLEKGFSVSRSRLDLLLAHIIKELKWRKQDNTSVIVISDDEEDVGDEITFITKWLKTAIYQIKRLKVTPQGTVFIIHLTAVVCENEGNFLNTSFVKVVGTLFSCIKQRLKQSGVDGELFFSCLKLFSSFLIHTSGVQWIISHNIVDFLKYLTQQRSSSASCMNSIPSREIFKFVAKLLQKCRKYNKNFLFYTLTDLLAPLKNCDNNIARSELVTLKRSVQFLIGVMEELLEQCCQSADFEVFFIFRDKCNYESTVRSAFNIIQDEVLIFSLNNILFLSTFFELGRWARGSSPDKLREAVWNFGLSLIEAAKTSKMNGVMKLCFLSHTYFAYANRNGPMTLGIFEKQMLLLQFMPLLCNSVSFGDIQSSNNNISDQDEIRQDLVTKFLKGLYPTTLRIYMSWKEHLNNNSLCDATDALKYILETRQFLSREAANLAVQMLIYLVADLNIIRRKNPEQLPVATETYVELLLETLIAFVEEFHLTGVDSVEAVSLLEIAFDFLCLISNSIKLEIKALNLLNTAIAHYMSPTMALLIDDVGQSLVGQLGPLITTKLFHDDWKVRHSALKIVHTMSFNSNEKFPSFREVIIHQNYPNIVLQMAMLEGETAMKITAFKCLQELALVDDSREILLENEIIFDQLLHILFNDQDYLVRTEVVILITDLYGQDLHDNVNFINVYKAIQNSLRSEKNRQVKIAIMDFLLKVINVVLKKQGMIDGSFPEATFSKELKRIITFNKTKIRSCLSNALSELSVNGCLAAFVHVLKNETDSKVFEAAEKNLLDLINLLNKYDVQSYDLKEEEEYLNSPSCSSPSLLSGIPSPAIFSVESEDLDSLSVEELLDLNCPDLMSQQEIDDKDEMEKISPNGFFKFVKLEMDHCKTRFKTKTKSKVSIDGLLDSILKL